MLCYAKSFQSCPTLCDPIDGSPPGSPVPGILPARTLEWVAISFSLKYKNTVSQKTSYRDTELQIQGKENISGLQRFSKGGKEARLKEEGGGGGRGGQKGGLIHVSCHLQIPRHYRTLPWASREGRTGTRSYQKPDQNRTRI